VQRIASFQEFRPTRQQGGRGGPCVQYGLRRIGWGWCISILRSKEKHHEDASYDQDAGLYMLIDATGEAPDGAGFAPTSVFHSEEDLRTALKGFDITDKAITEAVKEVNATGDAFVGPLVRSDNCCDRDSRASRPGVFE